MIHRTELNFTSTWDPSNSHFITETPWSLRTSKLPSQHAFSSIAVKLSSVVGQQCCWDTSSRIYSSWRFPASPRNQFMAACALWLDNSSKRRSAGVHREILAQMSARQQKRNHRSACFPFDCSTSSLKCLHAAHVLSKKRQKPLKPSKLLLWYWYRDENNGVSHIQFSLQL